jgi:hypothetical protein
MSSTRVPPNTTFSINTMPPSAVAATAAASLLRQKELGAIRPV